MKQRKAALSSSSDWCSEEELPEETRCKLEGLKVIARWLVGLKDEKIMAKKTFRMLNAFIINDGDLNLNTEFRLRYETDGSPLVSSVKVNCASETDRIVKFLRVQRSGEILVASRRWLLHAEDLSAEGSW